MFRELSSYSSAAHFNLPAKMFDSLNISAETIRRRELLWNFKEAKKLKVRRHFFLFFFKFQIILELLKVLESIWKAAHSSCNLIMVVRCLFVWHLSNVQYGSRAVQSGSDIAPNSRTFWYETNMQAWTLTSFGRCFCLFFYHKVRGKKVWALTLIHPRSLYESWEQDWPPGGVFFTCFHVGTLTLKTV